MGLARPPGKPAAADVFSEPDPLLAQVRQLVGGAGRRERQPADFRPLAAVAARDLAFHQFPEADSGHGFQTAQRLSVGVQEELIGGELVGAGLERLDGAGLTRGFEVEDQGP